MNPGIPVAETLESGQPPRVHSLDVPGGEPRPAEEVIAELIERLSGEQ